MKVIWRKDTFTILPTVMIVPKKYPMKKRTYICFAWLYWWGDLID